FSSWTTTGSRPPSLSKSGVTGLDGIATRTWGRGEGKANRNILDHGSPIQRYRRHAPQDLSFGCDVATGRTCTPCANGERRTRGTSGDLFTSLRGAPPLSDGTSIRLAARRSHSPRGPPPALPGAPSCRSPSLVKPSLTVVLPVRNADQILRQQVAEVLEV